MIRCPGCNLPVFKDQGCDTITCSNCSTNFVYSTGEKGAGGSVNQKIQLAPEKRLLSSLYGSTLDDKCLNLLLRIESLQPLVVSKNTILRPLYNSIKKSSSSATNPGKNMARLLEKYTISKYKTKKYMQIMTEIEKYFLKKEFYEKEKKQTVEDFLFDTLEIVRDLA